jgi:hypothetical protein
LNEESLSTSGENLIDIKLTKDWKILIMNDLKLIDIIVNFNHFNDNNINLSEMLHCVINNLFNLVGIFNNNHPEYKKDDFPPIAKIFINYSLLEILMELNLNKFYPKLDVELYHELNCLLNTIHSMLFTPFSDDENNYNKFIKCNFLNLIKSPRANELYKLCINYVISELANIIVSYDDYPCRKEFMNRLLSSF